MSCLLEYLRYRVRAGHRRGFGIHSPFMFHLVTNVIEEDLPYYKYSLVEKIRDIFIKSDEKIGVLSPDGSKQLYHISEVAHRRSVSPKFGQLLFRLVNYFKPEVLVEVGATTGISTLYLATPNSRTRVYALTSQPELVDLVKNMCCRVSISNIEWYQGDNKPLYDSLTNLSFPGLSFVYINQASPEDVAHICQHQFQKISSQTVVVINGIYSSKQMKSVWLQVKAMPEVNLSIDLFTFGLLIKNPDLQKEDFTLSF